MRLYPAFGSSNIKKKTIYIRKDLPFIVREFVKEHELYHLKDKSKTILWREIKASVYAGIKHPIGFFLCVIMSLSPSRLRFYYKRFKMKR